MTLYHGDNLTESQVSQPTDVEQNDESYTPVTWGELCETLSSLIPQIQELADQREPRRDHTIADETLEQQWQREEYELWSITLAALRRSCQLLATPDTR